MKGRTCREDVGKKKVGEEKKIGHGQEGKKRWRGENKNRKKKS